MDLTARFTHGLATGIGIAAMVWVLSPPGMTDLWRAEVHVPIVDAYEHDYYYLGGRDFFKYTGKRLVYLGSGNSKRFPSAKPQLRDAFWTLLVHPLDFFTNPTSILRTTAQRAVQQATGRDMREPEFLTKFQNPSTKAVVYVFEQCASEQEIKAIQAAYDDDDTRGFKVLIQTMDRKVVDDDAFVFGHQRPVCEAWLEKTKMNDA